LKKYQAGVVILFILVACVSAAEQESIVGAWTITEAEFYEPDGERSNHNEAPLESLWIFTADGYYSRMRLTGTEPRERLTPESTVEERLESVTRVWANSGRYELSGDTLVYSSRMVANNVNTMGPQEQSTTLTVAITGDTMTVTTDYSDGAKRVLHLRRAR